MNDQGIVGGASLGGIDPPGSIRVLCIAAEAVDRFRGKGHQAAAPQEPGRVRGAVRETVRNAARGAYRHGVQRVAPVIRRMGEL